MTIDLSTIGTQSDLCKHRYDWKQQAAYALGIGCTTNELSYLYEKAEGGMKVYPTYAVVPAFETVIPLLIQANVDLAMVVHGAQKVTAHRAVPSSGEMETVAILSGIYDMRKFAQLIIDTKTSMDGEALFDTQWSIIVRGAGGFKGERPPKDTEAVKIAKDRQPDWTVSHRTSPEQALLYRLSGDANPLHADPAFAAKVGFEQGPILHGLCTYGHVARAVVNQLAGGDATRLRTLAAQFRKPVWPGDTIVTHGYDLGDGKVGLMAYAEGRPDPVVTNAWAQLDQ